MGVGPQIIALYRQLKLLGAFEGIERVMELGAQDAWSNRPSLVESLFEAFGRPAPDPELLERLAAWKGSARELYQALGFSYECVDLMPDHGSLRLDLNFDEVPESHRGRYDFVTNHGTSEHIFDQRNCFKAMHDFCRAGGLLLHAVPFTVHLEHGFYNYQPNFFTALATYNGYATEGMWVGPDWQLASLVPWEPQVLDYLTLNAKTTHLLVVLQRKRYDTPFCVPFQAVYESMTPKDALARYATVVDGDLLDHGAPRPAQPGTASPLRAVPGRALLKELRYRIIRKIRRRLAGA